MSGKLTGILCVTASALALASAPAAHAQQADQSAAAGGGSGLEEIVVTARRKEEKLQTVPVSVTVVTGAKLEEARIQTLADLSFQAPSLAFRNVQRDVDGIVNMRGLTGVVTYLNDIPLGGVSVPGTGGSPGPGGGAGPGVLYDLADVEVLKGPQGTLFGRNTTGGAIRLQTQKPTNDFGGYVQEQFGNYNDREFEGAINIPIIQDKLLLRVSANIAQRDGFTQAQTPNGIKDLDNRDYWSERVQLTWRPTDDFENEILAFSLYKHENGTGIVLNYINPVILGTGRPASPGVAAVTPSLSAAQYSALVTDLSEQNAMGVRNLVGHSDPNPLDKDWDVGVLDTATFNVNDNLTIKNLASYIDNKVVINQDLDGSPATILDQTNGNSYTTDTGQITEELQFQGKALNDKLNITAGAFGLYVHPENNTTNPNQNQQTLVSSSRGLGIDVITTLNNVVERSQAAYAQFDYDLSGISDVLEGFKFTGGYRYTWDYRSVALGQYTTIPSIHAKLCSQTGADKNCVVAGDGYFHSPSFTYGMQYQITPDMLLYAKTSKGYQSGGFNLLSPFAAGREFSPEYLDDVEVGYKADWDFYGMKARTDIDYYTGWFNNIQASVPVVNPLNNQTVTLVTNAAKATIQGVEFEGTLIPVDGVELSANYAYNGTQYQKFNTPFGSFAGQPFLYVPKNKYTLSGKYHLPINPDYGDVSVQATWNWQGHVSLGYDLSSPGSVFGDVKTLDLNVSWNNIMQYPVDLSFFMTNALDATYSIGVYALYTTSGFVSSIYGEPQMWGFKLKYHFGGPESEPQSAPAAYVPPAAQAPVAVPKSYMVFFDFNKSDLTPQAVEIVDTAAKNAGPAKVTQLTVTGHTDTVGSDAYNMRLSKRRAESVAAELEKQGIASSEIEIVAKGKRDLLVPTKDGVREPQNRRVQIVYDNGMTS
jgi:iron complex outermembrane receptor protein